MSGSLKIIKKDEDGNYLEGVKFNILDSNRRKIDTITTDSSGVAVSKTLNPGTYYYQGISIYNKFIR